MTDHTHDEEAVAPRDPWGIPELFIISQTALPAMLFLPGTQAIRFPLRVGAFLISFALLAWWMVSRTRHEDQRHPASAWVVAVVSLVALMLVHPLTTTLTGGVAQLALYVCVIAPVFWAPALVRTPTRLRRIMALLLICNGLNSLVGVLQVYDPGRWLPEEFSRLVTQSELGLGPLTYQGANGELIVRPPGLFDTPGAVAGPGIYAALLGLIFAATRFTLIQRLFFLSLSLAGLAAIYLSQVRISIVVATGMLVVYFLVLLVQRRVSTATVFGTMTAAALVGALTLAVTLAGAEVIKRFATLFEDDPFTVYYVARGGQLSYALTETLFDFPLGAGLARWGMSATYFGRATLDAPILWAEIQLAGWILDGGILLMALYCAALAASSIYEFGVAARSANPAIAACGAAVFAANLGPIAMIVSFTPFMTQIGVQYWFLAGALHGVVQQARQDGWMDEPAGDEAELEPAGVA